MKKIKLLILINSVILTSTVLYSSETITPKKQTATELSFSRKLQSKVLEAIENSHNIPGLKAEEFSALKGDIVKNWNTLVADGILEITGTDKDIRPSFVSIQALIEHVLSSELQKEVKTLKGFIHTPMPATALCTPGKISRELVDPSIAIDPYRLFTVKARKRIVRDYLFKGGNLYVIYPKTGLEKRSEEQQKTYKQELQNYSKHLFDVPLNCETIPLDLIGATYLFQSKQGKNFVFSIKMTQANDPKEFGTYALWFGPLEHPLIQKRVKEISTYIKQNGSNVL